MNGKNHYTVLGIDQNASFAEIKSAHRRLARKHHPDLHPNDKKAKEKFQAINEANEVLSDPDKRADYDATMHPEKAIRSHTRHRQPNHHDIDDMDDVDDDDLDEFDDLADFQFEEIINNIDASDIKCYEWHFGDTHYSIVFTSTTWVSGQGKITRHPWPGADLDLCVELTLAQAATRQERRLVVNGRTVEIDIPAGIKNGKQIKYKGCGLMGVNGGPDGNLSLIFKVREDPHFQLKGDDLYSTVDIDLRTAVLGGKVDVNTLTDKVKATILPQTAGDTMLRLKGKGFPKFNKNGQAGDLYLKVMVKVPKRLTEEEKKLFRKLQEKRH